MLPTFPPFGWRFDWKSACAFRLRSVRTNTVPAIGEFVQGYDAISWLAIMAPAHTPQPVVDRMHAELARVMALPEFQIQLLKVGMISMNVRDAESSREFLSSEFARWGDVIRRAGLAGSQ